MHLNLIESLDIKGHLTISKLYPTGKEEIVFDDHNIIVSGMGVALAHMFALSGSTSILDYQIDRFQLGVSGSSPVEVSTTTALISPLSSMTEYAGTGGNILTTSGYQIRNNAVVATPVYYGLIPQHNITRIDDNTVRYTILVDQDSCNNLSRGSDPGYLSEIGLFIKNIKSNNPAASILVAYRAYSYIRKTTDFALVFRWSISF
tara:strand:- start:320 stop:931 length:612 start_codon:yes stop_codon:yes gene_type:complete